VGKWHLGYCNTAFLPTRRGFDTFFGQLQHSTNYRTRRTPCADPMMRGEMLGYDLWRNESISTDYRNKYSPNMFAKEAVRVISKHPAASNPLFLYVPFMAIHSPFVGSPPKR
jgi:arylsulfatase A-like enzyme